MKLGLRIWTIGSLLEAVDLFYDLGNICISEGFDKVWAIIADLANLFGYRVGF